MEYEILILMSAFVLFAVYIVCSISHVKPKPDPWEKEISKEDVDKLKHEICLNCGAEVKPGQYYCPKCNRVTGKYVPYLPFVNIQFNYSMHRTLWANLKSKDYSLGYKIVTILFIAITAPAMIAGYLVMLIWRILLFPWKGWHCQK